MFRFLLIVLLFGCYFTGNCQVYSKKKVSASSDYILSKNYDLPDELAESSGIIIYDSLIWTFNDSGGKPVIYGLLPESGKIVRTVEIMNGTNKDWEDIAQNKKYIFIGDFGNNDGSRKDLKIYLIPKESINKNPSQSINAGILDYKYEDQADFTPALYANPFDCEAMIATDDSVYVFTKDWLNLKTSIYSLPAIEGKVMAKHIKDFDSDGLITGADLNPENGRLILCGYNLFYPIIILIDNPFSMNVLKTIELEEISGAQVEGITSYGNNKYFFTNEKSSIPQSLHKIIINQN